MLKYLLKNIRSLEMSVQKRNLSPKKTPPYSVTKRLRLSDAKCATDSKGMLKDEKDELKQVQENYDFLFDEESEFDLDALDAAVSDANVKKLDLSKWKRCVVEEVERDRKTFDLVLKLSAEEQPLEENKENKDNILEQLRATCRLQGPWCHTRVEAGDVLSLLGTWDEKLQAFKVNKDEGFCVTNPDTLISGTTVVGSLFCRRKAVLQDRFRGVDADNKVMVIGSLVHELFQIVLAKGLKTYKAIDAAAKELLESQETAFTLYASRMTRQETAIEMQKFVPNILTFMQQYIEGQDPPVLEKDMFQGTIAEIKDIEENLWVPQFGLKGKVDVSVRIQRRKNAMKFENMNKNAIPLELKTGRATFSMEHRGQVILYQMMLTAAGKSTNSGLLLYLREGIMREIQGARNEQRDLVVLRNDLSHYLSRLPSLPPSQVPLAAGDGKFLQPFELPEPISHRACANCAYATLCCSFAKTNRDLQLRSGHPLVKVMEETTSHLKPEDYEYFIRWCGLLSLEEQEAKKSNYLRSLWTDPPEIRVRNGRAIIDLDLLDKVEFKDARYLHSFKQKTLPDSDEIDLTLCGFSVGEYVIVSSKNRLAIAAGCIYDLSKSMISISLERNLLKNYTGQSFIIDKHDSQSGNVFNYTNLGLLLDNSERSNTLRSIVVHREQPTFSKVLPKIITTEGRDILNQLNSIQRAAVYKALSTESFMLIKGLPGTGKTQTLVAIVRLLNLMGKSVVITSHTHSAVDNLMLRLKPHSLKMLRLGSGARVNPQLREFAESELTANCKTEDDLAGVYTSHNIVGVTCLGSAHSIFLYRKFDVCIVDEATQVMQPTVLRPLFFCDKFILVGDPDQLPPLIRSKEARQRGADESLFQRLDSEQATAVLTLQYRMNKTITKLANHLTYSGELKCASKEVEAAAIKLEATPTPAEKWLQRAVHPHIDQAVVLLDTLDCADRSYEFASSKHSTTCSALEQTFAEDPADIVPDASSPHKQKQKKRLSKYTNYCDAAVVFHIVKHLLSTGYDANRIGIIAPYRAQVELLRKLSEQHAEVYRSHTGSAGLDFANVEVNTVDQYQGRDKDVIIYSCAKTGAASARDTERSREAEILEDKRRLTVAITRSKHKLILVGDAACLQQYTPFQELMSRIPNMCKLKLEEGKLGFSWESLLGELSKVINS